MVVLYGNDVFSILVRSVIKGYCSFFKVFVFYKICFKVKALLCFTDRQIKTCRSLRRRAIFKIPSWFENEISKKKPFPVSRQKLNQILP